MKAVRFHTQIGADQVIHTPTTLKLPEGPAEIIVLQTESDRDIGPNCENDSRSLFERLATLADDLGVDTSDLPTDLAKNHDYYLHGLEKRP